MVVVRCPECNSILMDLSRRGGTLICRECGVKTRLMNLKAVFVSNAAENGMFVIVDRRITDLVFRDDGDDNEEE